MSDNTVYTMALGVEYNGANYFGWQKQQSVISVQSCLEKALSFVANQPIEVNCAGRTDAGVHATGQVVHFKTTARRNLSAWTMGVNANLPSDIAIQWAKNVDVHFHARFSATARRYRYLIYNHHYRSAILPQNATHYHLPLDAEKMQRAAQVLIGEHDFTSFRAAHCQSKTPWRNIKHLLVNRYGNYLVIDIKANAFVHHMVRNIVGSLLEIGCGNQPEEWLAQLLAAKDRCLASATAKANGLYLVSVDYPAEFALPNTTIAPLFGIGT